MKYYSTKDKACARAFSLREAVQAGLAPDGGLFVPERIPQADMAVAERLARLACLPRVSEPMAADLGALEQFVAGI